MDPKLVIPPFGNPFRLTDDSAYRAWREHKLRDYPTRLEALIVEVGNPLALTEAEHAALLGRCRKTNLAVYRGPGEGCADKEIPKRLGHQFGLQRLDRNWLADDDAVTSLTVTDATDHQHYIPYTNRPLKWHTDGYYNGPRRQIHGLLLHCVHPAAAGGENALLDHEIAYIFLRDENPDFIRVLMEPEVMTIPAREEDGSTARPACTGPVFSVDPVSGALHMRYTARRHHVHWKAEPLVRAAVSFLAQLLTSDLPFIFRGRLEAGMGLLCNNVLHDRAGFDDAPGAPPRLLYRARYYDRIAGT